MNAREKMLALVIENGWSLDTDVKRHAGFLAREQVQDPHAFRRQAGAGGYWRIRLDYVVSDTLQYTVYDSRLRGVRVSHVADDGTVVSVGDLVNPGKWGYSPLWNVIPGSTLRDRAEKLVTGPDLWLSLLTEYRYNEKWLLAEHRYNEKQVFEARIIERSRPLPITVDKHEWSKLAVAIRSAANAIYRADGRTDLPAVIAEARKALEDIEGVLK